MVNSKTQKKVIDLGKSIVSELKLDPGVDTLGKWIAHYVAEKIILTEKLTGKEKNTAEKECYDLILKLWEHRWSIPRDKPFLKDFEPLLKTLEKLSTKERSPFFFSPRIELELEEEISGKDLKPIKDYFKAALKVDMLARSIIYNLLNRAVADIELGGDRGKVIRNAIDLIDYPDTNIIRILSRDDEFSEASKEDNVEISERMELLKKKIQDLENFSCIRDKLLEDYQKELTELEKKL